MKITPGAATAEGERSSEGSKSTSNQRNSMKEKKRERKGNPEAPAEGNERLRTAEIDRAITRPRPRLFVTIVYLLVRAPAPRTMTGFADSLTSPRSTAVSS